LKLQKIVDFKQLYKWEILARRLSKLCRIFDIYRATQEREPGLHQFQGIMAIVESDGLKRHIAGDNTGDGRLMPMQARLDDGNAVARR